MAATLKIKKEYLESEIHYGHNNSSYSVKLWNATQAELQILHKLGDFDHIFEKAEEKK